MRFPTVVPNVEIQEDERKQLAAFRASLPRPGLERERKELQDYVAGLPPLGSGPDEFGQPTFRAPMPATQTASEPAPESVTFRAPQPASVYEEFPGATAPQPIAPPVSPAWAAATRPEAMDLQRQRFGRDSILPERIKSPVEDAVLGVGGEVAGLAGKSFETMARDYYDPVAGLLTEATAPKEMPEDWRPYYPSLQGPQEGQEGKDWWLAAGEREAARRERNLPSIGAGIVNAVGVFTPGQALRGAKGLMGTPKGIGQKVRAVDNVATSPEVQRVARRMVPGGTLEDVTQAAALPDTPLVKATPLAKAATEAIERAKGTDELAAQLRPVEEGFAGNVRLSKNIEAAQEGITETLANAGFKEFAGQRRGVVTDEVAAAKARQIAQERTIEDWLKIKPGTPLIEEERLALDQTLNRAWADRAQMVSERAALQRNGQSTITLDARIGEQTLVARGLTAVSTGVRSEAGRLLRSYRSALNGEYGSGTKAIQKAYEAFGGTERFEKWLDEFQAIPVDDVAGQYRMMQQLFKPTKSDMFNAWRYASMLSSWKTHGANITSTIAESVDRPLTLLVAGYGREAAADVYGMAKGLPAARQAFKDAMAIGASQFDNASIIENARPRPFGQGKLGRAITLPSDLLMAEDDALKAINYSGSLHAQAYRLARGNTEKADELLRNPTDEMVRVAKETARYATFTNDPNILVRKIIDVANTPGGYGAAVRVILPFIRTPANIYIRGLDMMLRPVLTGPARMALAAAKKDQRAFRLEAAKTLKATAGLAGLYAMAMSGDLTGQGPSDPAKRRILEESGWQSNSIKVAGRWIAYNNFGPISIPMAAVAAVKEGLDEGQKPNADLAAKVADRVYNSMLDTSFVQGLSDVLRGEGIVGRAAQIGSSLAGSAVPYSAALAATERVIDPTVRAKDDPLAAVQGRIPFASKLQPAEPNIYGGERQQGAGDTIAQILLPWRTGTNREDPVAKEVARLNQSPETRQAGVSVGVRQFSSDYAGAKQTPEQRRMLQSEAGQLAATYIADAIAKPEYQGLSDVQKAATLNKMLGTAYELADLQLGDKVSRDPRHQALLMWASEPHYQGVDGSEEEIRRENYKIANAKAKVAEYTRLYGPSGKYRLAEEDEESYLLARRKELSSRYLTAVREEIDAQFGGALTQAENQGLIGAGNTILPVGGAR